ncbi:MAG: type II toxin-antitoxin system RelE/ParE family toxin [Acidobacteriia bacterium]|nr:type II toxin-antitoxin system RelE/ParE family toxin [Terriglobia bacterium]
MAWEVEFTDEFEQWWNSLTETEQIKIAAAVRLLEEYGPDLPYPMSSGVTGSRHTHMRELRVQIQAKPFRVLYAFNPKRAAILLVGGDKTGDHRWYDVNVPLADRLYDQHLAELKKEASKEGSQK